MRRENNGLRKRCECPRRTWAKCPHDWHFNFQLRGGTPYRFSLDRELGRRLKSKADAEGEAERIRTEIRAGTFQRVHERAAAAQAAAQVTPPAPVTLKAFAAIYLARVSEVRVRNKSWTNDRYMFARLGAFQRVDGAPLDDVPLRDVTEDDVEGFFLALRKKGRAISTRNSYVTLVKKAFRWATKKKYLTDNPLAHDRQDEDTALKRAKPAKRDRRLLPEVLDDQGVVLTRSEEQRLLAVAPPHLQSLIIGAIETCCRRGELLALQWADVDLPRRWLRVRAENAKDNETRELPISQRLAAVLEMLKTDPLGKEYSADKYVFGELGIRVKSVKRAWDTAVLKAHGHTPIWSKKGAKLAPASRALLQTINLHFHDLRHEGGSRLLEAGWPLHHVQEMLGHASIEQTSTYLNVAKGGLQDSMRKSDEARTGCTLLHANPETAASEPSVAGKENTGKVTIN